MSNLRFYLGHELCVDLDSVSLVGYDHAVVGGQVVKFAPSVAFDIRKQFRAYKEFEDKKVDAQSTVVGEAMRALHWSSVLIGSRIQKSLKGAENGQ